MERKTLSIVKLLGLSLLHYQSLALTINEVEDNGPLDLDPRIGHIRVGEVPVDFTYTTVLDGVSGEANGVARASENSAGLSILGNLFNRSNETIAFSLSASVPYMFDIDVPVPGSIGASVSAELQNLGGGIGLPTSAGASALLVGRVTGFVPMDIMLSDSVAPGVVLVGDNSGLFAAKRIRGTAVSQGGSLILDVTGELGPMSALRFENSFDDGVVVPDSSNSILLLILGCFCCAQARRWCSRRRVAEGVVA